MRDSVCDASYANTCTDFDQVQSSKVLINNVDMTEFGNICLMLQHNLGLFIRVFVDVGGSGRRGSEMSLSRLADCCECIISTACR